MFATGSKLRTQDIYDGALVSQVIQVLQTAQIDSASTVITLSFGAVPQFVVIDLATFIVTPYGYRASIAGSLIYLSLWGGTYSGQVGVFGSLGATVSYPFRITGVVASR